MTRESSGLESDRRATLVRRSIEIILANQAPGGGYLASPNFSVYQYCWLRDGSFIADAMSRAGHGASASAFFDWCRRVVEARVGQIDELARRRRSGEAIGDHEYLHTRYSIDGEEGEAEWWNHQLDGYGAWLWALGAHWARSPDDRAAERFAPAVEATARYLTTFWDLPCYDCWEENRDQIHVATLAAVASGLRVAAAWPGVSAEAREESGATVGAITRLVGEQGIVDGHLVKWLGGKDLDASLLFCALPYGLFCVGEPVMQATVARLIEHLVCEGIHRHVHDTYFGGGEWPLLTALLGSHLAAIGDLAGAQAKLEWVADQADDSGWLPEQVSTHMLHPEHFEEWERRWGPVASPLLWSHAMYLNLYRELNPDG